MNEAVEMQGTPNHSTLGSTLGQSSHRKLKQRIKDNPCTQGFGGKLSSKAAKTGKASGVGHDGFKLKTGLQETAHGWEISSFPYWYKIAEETETEYC